MPKIAREPLSSESVETGTIRVARNDPVGIRSSQP
jgi:hypothetical protein